MYSLRNVLCKLISQHYLNSLLMENQGKSSIQAVFTSMKDFIIQSYYVQFPVPTYRPL